MVKTIIVPIDFSANALAAAKYACQLAVNKNYNVHLFHCYTSDSVSFDDESDNNDENSILKADLLILNVKQQLENEFALIHISTECVSGLLTEVLPEKVKSNDYTLVVMGTTGSGKGKSIVWGSNTSIISSKSTIPVLAIPATKERPSFHRLAMLTNFKNEELETIKEFIQLVSNIDHLDIIHVYRKDVEAEDLTEHLELWAFNIKNLNGIKSVATILQPTIPQNEDLDTIPEVISDLIEKENYDAILITKTRKTFFQRLFSTSISKEIVLNLKHPTFFDNN